jgi:uncharacterized RDD family membrane protein YckC
MTQSPDHPQEQGSQGAASTPPPAPEPTSPYPSAPPISEPYGAPQAQGALAGRGKRLLAAIIDGVITGAIGFIIAAPLVGAKAMTSNSDLGARFGANGITAVIAILYFALQHGKWGQSIGKRALGIRVVRAADSGPIGYGAAFGRVLFTYVFSLITLGLGSLIDAVWVLWDGRKQALHDKVVKTVVVNADGPDPYAGA